MSQLLADQEAESLYLRIAECYMLQQKYALALEHLDPIKNRVAEKSMIEKCNRELQASSSITQPRIDVFHPKQIAREVVKPRPWWLDNRQQFIDRAKQFLEYEVRTTEEQGILDKGKSFLFGAKKSVSNYDNFSVELSYCIAMYAQNHVAPTDEEVTLYKQLCTLQEQLQIAIKQREDEIVAQHLREKNISDMHTAQQKEPLICADLKRAQQHLATNNLSEALTCLNSAYNNTNGDHAKFFTNEAFRNINNFKIAANKLRECTNNFNNTRTRRAREFAERVVNLAFPSDKRLFYVHRDRIIAAMENQFDVYMRKFGLLDSRALSLVPMFERMSNLIKMDAVDIDTNKWLWRGGWFDHKQLVHSHTISDLLQQMIAMEPFKLANISLDIFRVTGTEIEVAIAETYDNPDLIDWYASLRDGTKLIHNAVQLDASVPMAVVASNRQDGANTKTYQPTY